MSLEVEEKARMSALGAVTRRVAFLRRRLKSHLPGLFVAVVIAILATAIGHRVPVVGAPVIAIVTGIVIASLRPISASLRSGIAFASRSVLQLSIVVLGTGLSLHEVFATGLSSLPVLFGSLFVALIGAQVFGAMLGVDRDLKTLIGVGTGICGASAIAATNAVIDAAENDVSYAIATIFTFNVAAVLTFPSLGHLFHLSPRGFGLWAGTAINDLSSVVAASSIFGHGATSTAVVVKLARTLMIIPISIAISLIRAHETASRAVEGEIGRRRPRFREMVPLFMGWFLVAVIFNTVGLIPSSWQHDQSVVAQFLITVALAAIGLSAHVREIRRTGFRPLALGAILWLLVALTAIGLQHLTGAANV